MQDEDKNFLATKLFYSSLVCILLNANMYCILAQVLCFHLNCLDLPRLSEVRGRSPGEQKQ